MSYISVYLAGLSPTNNNVGMQLAARFMVRAVQIVTAPAIVFALCLATEFSFLVGYATYCYVVVGAADSAGHRG